MTNLDRYLRVVRWAQRRAIRAGVATGNINGVLKRYSQIDQAAWRRYLGE